MFKQILAVLALLLGVAGLVPGQAYGFSVENVRFGKFENNTRFVLELSQDSEFRIFSLEAPNRIVIDIPNGTWNAPDEKPDPTGLVKSYRYGAFKSESLRVVLDLSQPACIQSAFLLPRNMSDVSRLVLDMQGCSVNNFHQSLNKIFGTSSEPGTTQSVATPSSTAKPVITMSDEPKGKKQTVIVIDPGHGGSDPGAIAKNGAYEKHVTLAIAKKLRNQLQKKNYTVYLTRENDRFIKLRDRTKFARKKGADLFISLHADSIQKRDVQGASIYTLSDKASDKESAMLAERENKADALSDIDLSHEEEDVADILIDLAMRDTMNQSKTMADNLADSLKANRVRLLERPLRSAGFAVLKAPDMPAILIEMGYLSSEKEARMLNQADYQNRLSEAMATGIDRYLEKRELADIF